MFSEKPSFNSSQELDSEFLPFFTLILLGLAVLPQRLKNTLSHDVFLFPSIVQCVYFTFFAYSNKWLIIIYNPTVNFVLCVFLQEFATGHGRLIQ